MAKMTKSELIWLQLKALFAGHGGGVLGVGIGFAGLGGGVLGVGIGFVTFRVMLALGIWPFIQYGHTGIAVHAVLGLFVLFIVCPLCFGVLGIQAVLGRWPFHKKSPRSP